MAVSYKNETPIFKSKFLNAIESGDENVHFLGNHISDNGDKRDMYLVLKNKTCLDLISIGIQYGDKEHEYDSGVFGLWIDLLNDENTAHRELYNRAIENGLFKEKTGYIGYSELYRDIADEKYYESEYYAEMPKYDDYVKMRDEYEDIDQMDFDIERFETDLRSYQFTYIEKHGELPKEPGFYSFHLFDNKAHAEEMCVNKMGVFEEIRYVNQEHLYYIDRHNGYMAQQLNNSIERVRSEKERENLNQ